MHLSHLRISRALVCIAVASVTAGTAGCASAEPAGTDPTSRTLPQFESYVALGDSFTSGPGIPPPKPGDQCGRSEVNYPTLVATELGIADFTDASCSGANSLHLSEPQVTFRGATIPPQYDALRPDTDLVTVGIGGNDVGLVQLAAGCVNLSPPPDGRSCAEANTAGGVDRVDEAIAEFAPTYDVIVDAIRARAPDARIVFVGYPTGIREEGCFPEQRLWPQDAAYIQSKIDRLDTAMRDAADEAGIDFVELRESTRGHDACAAPEERWIEGLTLSPGTVPLHPNAAGHRNAAEQVVSTLSE